MLTLQRERGGNSVGRPTKEVELLRETLEGQLATLGNAVVYIELAAYRVGSAVDYLGQGALLNPAIEDLAKARALVGRTQELIKQSSPSVFGGE